MKTFYSLPDFNKKLDDFIDITLQEDIGEGDHTSLACITSGTLAEGKLLIKDDGILAGMEVAKRIFLKVDPKLQIEAMSGDGQKVFKGDIALGARGSAYSLLLCERLVLNCMMRMSGIATMTHKLSALCKGTKAKVTDTRKTTPGLRLLEKWSVSLGGGVNHRWGLYDMILIKDNHIACAGSIAHAIHCTHSYLERTGYRLPIEIEASTLDDVREILKTGGVQRIMLDNFSHEEVIEGVKLIKGKYETEASGGINESNIRSYALSGVDFISVGALTHSVKGLDMSFKIIPLL